MTKVESCFICSKPVEEEDEFVIYHSEFKTHAKCANEAVAYYKRNESDVMSKMRNVKIIVEEETK